MSGSAFAVTHHAFSSGAGRTSDGNGSHASTLKSPSYTKSVSWQHYRVLYRELWPATYCSRVSRYPHRLPVQHILWSGRRRANCYWTHCMHGGEKCHAIQKSRLGEWFSCVLNQWGALCYYSVDGQAEADIMPRKKPFVPSVSEIKTLCSSAASAVHCCMGLSALAF
ncbi:putative IS element protein [Escherichia coli]|nr:putative IS element protein [Escherichia coli]